MFQHPDRKSESSGKTLSDVISQLYQEIAEALGDRMGSALILKTITGGEDFSTLLQEGNRERLQRLYECLMHVKKNVTTDSLLELTNPDGVLAQILHLRLTDLCQEFLLTLLRPHQDQSKYPFITVIPSKEKFESLYPESGTAPRVFIRPDEIASFVATCLYNKHDSNCKNKILLLNILSTAVKPIREMTFIECLLLRSLLVTVKKQGYPITSHLESKLDLLLKRMAQAFYSENLNIRDIFITEIERAGLKEALQGLVKSGKATDDTNRFYQVIQPHVNGAEQSNSTALEKNDDETYFSEKPLIGTNMAPPARRILSNK